MLLDDAAPPERPLSDSSEGDRVTEEGDDEQ